MWPYLFEMETIDDYIMQFEGLLTTPDNAVISLARSAQGILLLLNRSINAALVRPIRSATLVVMLLLSRYSLSMPVIPPRNEISTMLFD